VYSITAPGFAEETKGIGNLTLRLQEKKKDVILKEQDYPCQGNYIGIVYRAIKQHL
jgi:hypothetical protein